jgi:hypothetical protein
MHWTAAGGTWKYSEKKWDQTAERKCIEQIKRSGLSTLYHPDAYGFNSSFETVLSTDSVDYGWTGIFVQSPGPAEAPFSGNTFMINSGTDQIRLATHLKGRMVTQKILVNDFSFEPERLYTLTLSSVNGLLRGYIDNRNVISLEPDQSFEIGYAGLITWQGKASFDDFKFTALTPSKEKSRKIEVRFISGEEAVNLQAFSLNAFRWKKRYGLLPWHRSFKNPEPPGNIFGPDSHTVRPNPSAFWRAEDAANSALVHVNGTFFYFMRGNPDIHGLHGNAQIGTLWIEDNDFDGIHFTDPSLCGDENSAGNLIRGHSDTNNGNCSDDPPRDKRFQLNDEGCVYLDGKILMVCREFRNSNERSIRFKRLVLGVYDVGKRSWISEEPFIMPWSTMNPDSCFAEFSGINATPEITLLRDPVTDDYIILLYHHKKRERVRDPAGLPRSTNAVTGFCFDGHLLNKDPRYPDLTAIHKPERVSIFGERILFDNGIWYMHINAHRDGLSRDWPDRFELYSTLDPYKGPWKESSDNDRPYFQRGGMFDPDNGAIWQGEMLKYRNHYYMYYENYHVIDNPETMYEYYDHPQSGSRVGYAVAN